MKKGKNKIYIKTSKGQLINAGKTILSKVISDNWDKILEAMFSNKMPVNINMYPGELEYLNHHLKLGITTEDIKIYMDTYHPTNPIVIIKASIKDLIK
jgi:hypothetical protein